MLMMLALPFNSKDHTIKDELPLLISLELLVNSTINHYYCFQNNELPIVI